MPSLSSPPWLKKALNDILLPDNLREGISKLVALSGKSQEHLTRTMKQQLKITPSEWINLHRLERVKLLLVETDASILDIMYEVGFESEAWFYKCFKAQYQLTPNAYRLNYKGEAMSLRDQ